ncbi:MAG: hypothetical protein A2Y10_02530 [Planctomycetes bacterium GWF2_41_51]|nr:MAG: hypothetical protein A2Y10_02530 [Planctomycetes bacterium GWF2_41_51]HBG25682.1 hypothetical protein [Phycisphaerales bacterium]
MSVCSFEFNLFEEDYDCQCVICDTPLADNHKCTKESEKRYEQKLAAYQSSHMRNMLRRYGCGLTISEKIHAAFTVFGCAEAGVCDLS